MFRLLRALFRFLFLMLGVYLVSILVSLVLRRRGWLGSRGFRSVPRKGSEPMDDVLEASYTVVESGAPAEGEPRPVPTEEVETGRR